MMGGRHLELISQVILIKGVSISIRISSSFRVIVRKPVELKCINVLAFLLVNPE